MVSPILSIQHLEVLNLLEFVEVLFYNYLSLTLLCSFFNQNTSLEEFIRTTLTKLLELLKLDVFHLDYFSLKTSLELLEVLKLKYLSYKLFEILHLMYLLYLKFFTSFLKIKLLKLLHSSYISLFLYLCLKWHSLSVLCSSKCIQDENFWTEA